MTDGKHSPISPSSWTRHFARELDLSPLPPDSPKHQFRGESPTDHSVLLRQKRLKESTTKSKSPYDACIIANDNSNLEHQSQSLSQLTVPGSPKLNKRNNDCVTVLIKHVERKSKRDGIEFKTKQERLSMKETRMCN
jgi:hypothetical protein